MKHFLIILISFIWMNSFAYTIGNYTKTFYDASRNRNISTIIYYPINSANPSETFPYIVFGHGWMVTYSYTQSLTNALVNQGWIVAHPRTEEVLFPSHANFALDMAFLQSAVLGENTASTSALFGKIHPLAVVMGYSMGGGCAVVAASYNPNFASVVTFNAAETNVSAINAAANVTAPSITFAGSSDTVAPPNSHQIPIYNNLASVYKSYVSINGGTHTNVFSNTLVHNLLNLWLLYIKTNSIIHLSNDESLLQSNSSNLTYQLVNNLPPQIPPNVKINIADSVVTISWGRAANATGYKIFSSSQPDSGFINVTSQGSMNAYGRNTWVAYLPNADKHFYYVISER